MSEGELMKKLIDLKAGSQTIWQQRARGSLLEEDLRREVMSREAFQKWEEEGFQKIENSNAQARRIRDNQRDWLASRDRCRTIDCLRDSYNERISTLRSVLN